MERPEYLKYQVSGKIIKLLGRESVSTDTAALFELVKNSYDADATKVIISFEHVKIVDDAYKILEERYLKINNKLRVENPNLSLREIDELVQNDESYKRQFDHLEELKKRTKITVEDFGGTGMTIDTLENKWMIVGVSKNVGESITKKGRRVVGEKGVGRFAAEKLSKKLILTSYPENLKTAIIAEFNWDEFSGEKGITETKIPIRYETKEETRNGLKLELINLRERWSHRKIRLFLDELSLLVLPDKIQESHPFNITVKIDGEKEPFEVESSLLKKAPYFFTVELTSDSRIVFHEARYKKDRILPNQSGLELYGLKEISPFVRDDNVPDIVLNVGQRNLLSMDSHLIHMVEN